MKHDILDSSPWIGDGRSLPHGAAWFADFPAPQFRTEFSVAPETRAAVLRIACAGYFTVEVNGRRLTSAAPMPLWSPFDKTIYEERFRLGRRLLRCDGKPNEVVVTLGNGFRNLPPLKFWGRIVFRDHLASGAPCFKAAIDGKPLADWRWRETNILKNCVYLGTHIDATLGPGRWRKAVEVVGPKGRIVPRRAPAVEEYAVREGVSRWLHEGKTQVVDFGVNGTGVPEFRFDGEMPGTRIEIVYGERLFPDGSVNPLTQTAGQIKPRNPGGSRKAAVDGGEGAPALAAQRDGYVCMGGAETFRPPFAWHVARYAEVRGAKNLLAPGAAPMRLVASAVRDTPLAASFRAKTPELQRIHELCRNTFLANMVGVQSDCPGRERLGYGGDIVATCDAFCLNWDMREFYLKTLQDFADEAEEEGFITETAPFVGIHNQGFGKRGGPVSWALAVPTLIDALLRHYGDERGLRRHYGVCARYARLVNAECPDGIVPQCIGDHEALERPPDALVATAHWHEFMRLAAKFAGLLGRQDDEAEFSALARRIADAFAARWIAADGTVADGCPSAQSFALHLGLVPETLRQPAFSKLLEALDRRGFTPTAGIFGTRYLLCALSAFGRDDLALRVVLHRGFPGWLHMVERGATTLWEKWAEPEESPSNCHPMFGSVDEWIMLHAAQTAQLSLPPCAIRAIRARPSHPR